MSIGSKTILRKFLGITLVLLLFIPLLTCIPAYASGDVAKAVTGAMDDYMKPQIMDIVNKVVFPLIDVGLAVAFVVKIILSGIHYRKNGGDFEWTVPAILFLGLVVSLSAPSWIWTMLGWGYKA